MLKQVKPMLGQMHRGMGFGGTTLSSETGGGSAYRLDSGTRESSIGELMSTHLRHFEAQTYVY